MVMSMKGNGKTARQNGIGKNKKNGIGTYTFKSGDVYEGQWKGNGKTTIELGKEL